MGSRWKTIAALWASSWPSTAVAQSAEAQEGGIGSVLKAVDQGFGANVVGPIAQVLFFDLIFWDNGAEGDLKLPFIVFWLIAGATFFTLRFGFINIRAFKHALVVTTGHYDNPDDPGEVTHFQALSSALSATVGLGNIAGVAVAVAVGGPGAIFWMIVAGFLGMSSKFIECSLGQMYREVGDDGHILGGPMRYLDRGLAQLGLPRLGRFLAILFALMCIGGSFGGGNMFQANQSYAQVAEVLPIFSGGWGSLAYGVILSFLVGVVIVGGIRRIGQVAGFIVPLMCGVYLLAGLFIIITNVDQVVPAFGKIIGEAFSPQAGFGGMLGVLVTGFRRAAFSNEAGVGSASIAHSAAATDEPIREGIVALLEPFIDTILVCTMTGLVVVITGAYESGGEEGVLMTSKAFATVLPWFPKVLSLAVFLFAFSTMISWSYYGERCWTFLFGAQFSMVYKGLFLVFVVFGSVLKLGNVIDFSDLMILGMSFPNILGAFLLSGKVSAALKSYWGRYTSGQMQPRR
ncbi:MAG: alanine glycine permease [Deltaproteobacteria bacterium]|nr:alanine:cation symporter family protein [Deltaproteobacteria bacterium]MBW1874382.1 alanine:cation symporter family protein [Deltaproteobacteria bacterium]MBW2213071.1 alanine:cation symporter family protein [Deltaproteobacteria bacterium]MBW2378132.1 alanine:cation symporter family protein [Deltaproteobacteria bacterium]MBW2549555.1 alanine:cation symporter family protein [Deltaproteobacteria bacterium]